MHESKRRKRRGVEKKKKKKEHGALLRLLGGGVVCLFTDLHQKSPQRLPGQNPQAERRVSADRGLDALLRRFTGVIHALAALAL